MAEGTNEFLQLVHRRRDVFAGGIAQRCPSSSVWTASSRRRTRSCAARRRLNKRAHVAALKLVRRTIRVSQIARQRTVQINGVNEFCVLFVLCTVDKTLNK